MLWIVVGINVRNKWMTIETIVALRREFYACMNAVI
jgi:hypothetical protein